MVEAFDAAFPNDPAVLRRRLAEVFSPHPTPAGLLTRRELMALWRISKQTVQRYEREGLPIALKVGRHPRYALAEVEKWREDQSRRGRGGAGRPTGESVRA